VAIDEDNLKGIAMYSGLNRVAAYVAGLLLFAAVEQATGQETAANTPDQPQYRTWTNRQGATIEAKVLGLDEGKVLLKKKDDGKLYPVAVESLSDGDREYIRRHTSENVAEIDLSAGEKGSPPARPAAGEINVTGVGTDPEKATQNAFSQAIEQTVGVLVSAETAVKNDQLIRDEVLTYSRGYVERYKVVRQWQADGLSHATIRAVVAHDKLVAKLKTMKLAVQDVAGDLAAHQITFDVKNEEQAAQIFQKALDDFDMAAITKVKIVGKPDISRSGAGATVHLTAEITADQKRWNVLAGPMRMILSKTATQRATVTTSGKVDTSSLTSALGDHVVFGGRQRSNWLSLGTMEAEQRLKQQLEGGGVLIALLTNSSPDSIRLDWEVYRVPAPMADAIAASGTRLHYRVVYALMDEQGSEVLRTGGPPRTGKGAMSEEQWSAALGRQYTCEPLRAYWIGPVWGNSGETRLRTVLRTEEEISISPDDLRRVAKVTVILENDPKPQPD
jgi:hypothetical protein